MQVREGRHFLHEHPQTAVSWQLPVITRLPDLPGVATTVAHMCRYGMMQPDESWNGVISDLVDDVRYGHVGILV